jgi:transposase-like protein
VEVAEAYAALERLRWGGAPARCPHCDVPGRCSYLPPRTTTRRTRTGAPSGRRVWRCGACRRQFSVLTGTVLAGTRVPVPVVLATLDEWGRAGRPVAARLAERHGITGETARQVLRRIDAALAAAGTDDPVAATLGLPGASAAAVRGGTPARRHPRRQVGPTADHGTG